MRRSGETDEKKRRKITRVSGSIRVKLFSRFVDEFLSSVEEAKREFGKERYEALGESIATRKNKRSAKEQAVIEDEFESSVKSALNQTYKAEMEKGYELTAIMGGRVFLRILSKANGLEDTIDQEMIARNIPSDMEELVEKHGKGNDRLKEVSIMDKKKLLKLDEARRVMKKNPMLSEEEAMKKTNSIKPHLIFV